VERYEYNYPANPDGLTTLVDRQGGRYQWVYEERIAQWWNPEQPATETVLTQSSDPTGVSLQLHYEPMWQDFDVERRLPNPPILPSSIQLGSNPDRRWRLQYSYSASPNPPAPNGLLLGFAEPERRWWKFFYTPASFRQPFQLSLVLDPTGRAMQIKDWDSLGRPTRIETYPNRDSRRPLYQETEYTRFGQVRRIRWGYAHYNPQQVEYHWEGLQLTGFTDARGRTVRFEYVPGSGELHRIWIGTNLYAQLGYDWYGRLGRVAGGNNVGVHYGYGYRDERISIQHDGDANAERFYYSCCGQVSRWVRQDRREVWFDYTPNGWLQEAYIPTPTGRQRLAYYEYDLAGRLTFAQSPDAQYTFTYDTTDADRTGWLESSTAQFNTGTNSFTYTFHYDYYLNGDLRSVRREGPSAGWWEQNRSSESYTYDDAGRLLTQSYQRSGISLTVRYDYDGAGRLREQKVQIGNTTLLTDIAYADHESVGSIWWFNTYLNNSPIATFRYSYYPDGTVRQAEEQVGGSYQVWHWDYYADGSLQYERSGALPEGRRDYRYDAGGNLMRLPTTATPPSYEFNQLRRVGSWEFSYTPNGERASETNNPVAGYTGNWHYTYDLWGNLIAAYRNGQLVYEARYDAFGNRVWARTALGERYYLYEGDTLIAELDTNGQLIAEYVWGLLGPVARVERVSGFPPTYRVQLYVLDGLGHVRALVGQENGVWRVTDVYRYDSWGNLIARVGDTRQLFTWNGAYGYEWIPETGLYHVGAREYDPRTARWFQREPHDREVLRGKWD
jgi:RHS repeat-associated protein